MLSLCRYPIIPSNQLVRSYNVIGRCKIYFFSIYILTDQPEDNQWIDRSIDILAPMIQCIMPAQSTWSVCPLYMDGRENPRRAGAITSVLGCTWVDGLVCGMGLTSFYSWCMQYVVCTYDLDMCWVGFWGECLSVDGIIGFCDCSSADWRFMSVTVRVRVWHSCSLNVLIQVGDSNSLNVMFGFRCDM